MRLTTWGLALTVIAVVGIASLAIDAFGAQPEEGRPEQAETTCFGEPATIVGTSGDDNLTGTANNDVIVGLAGDDFIDGLDGDDKLCGGQEV